MIDTQSITSTSGDVGGEKRTDMGHPKNEEIAIHNIKNALGPELSEKYKELTFEEMLLEPELSEFRDDIQDAIDLWWDDEDQSLEAAND